MQPAASRLPRALARAFDLWRKDFRMLWALCILCTVFSPATHAAYYGPEGILQLGKSRIHISSIEGDLPNLLLVGRYVTEQDGTEITRPTIVAYNVDEERIVRIIQIGNAPSASAASSRMTPSRPETAPVAVPDTASGVALGMSRDGQTVVGFYDNGFLTPYHAFRWTEATDVVDLGTLDPPNNASRSSNATAVSSDGSVVVGDSHVAAQGAIIHAFRWTQAGGMQDLGSGAGSSGSSLAFGVSGDGNVIVGESDFPGGFSGTIRQAYRWTQAGGFQNLGSIQPDWPSVASAVTADGAVIVGHSGFPLGGSNTTRAFRWTQTGGMQNLGVLAGFDASAATAVSDDGTIVIGFCSNGPIDRNGVGGTFRGYGSDSRAFYWTEASGMQDLTQLLVDAGADTAGSTIVFVSGISADGEWIAGAAVTPTTEPNETEPVVASLTYTPPPQTSRLLNLSTRGLVQTGDNVLIPGFVISGTANKKLLIRAVGPTLGKTPFNLGGALANPRMTLKKFNTTVTPNRYDDIANNDDWATNANAVAITQTAEELFAFAFNDDLEAALLMDLAPGQYTVVADGVGGGTGIAIVELYDGDAASVDSRLINISNRGFCGVGDQVMIPGFVVSSESPRTVLIRVVGPTLGAAPFSVAGTIADPKLELYRREAGGTETLIETQDNWGDASNATQTAQIAAQVSAFPLTAGSKDAAFVATLAPGSYTVVGSSAVANGTGVVLVEVYVVQ